MPPVARLTDMHVCPMSDPKPHVGGPVVGPGVTTVLIGGMPVAGVGDMCTCAGPPDVIIKGSATVFIGGKPVARMGDNTAHGGVIVGGFPTVQIGG
ncbi:MAG TPA: PAAR domain-containing protein [Flavitalea sp.]|nr:PAAR domain-containing protein [Flavitalea sp.]